MGRPKFLNCIMTPEIIRRINEEQAHYDKDPEEYERRERQREEAIRQEEEEQRRGENG